MSVEESQVGVKILEPGLWFWTPRKNDYFAILSRHKFPDGVPFSMPYPHLTRNSSDEKKSII
jgi:hypothetical protein